MKLSKDRKETMIAAMIAIVTVIFIYVMLFYVGDFLDNLISE
jgi:branched-subunit amino acid permease